MISNPVSDRLHEVSLAKPYAPIDEKRVVGRPGILRDLDRRGPGQPSAALRCFRAE